MNCVRAHMKWSHGPRQGTRVNEYYLIKVELPPPVHFSICTEGFPYLTVWWKTPYNLYGRDRKPTNMAVPPIQNTCGPPPGPAGRSTAPRPAPCATDGRMTCVEVHAEWNGRAWPLRSERAICTRPRPRRHVSSMRGGKTRTDEPCWWR